MSDGIPGTAPVRKGFLGRILDIILGANDPARQKRRALRQIAKEIRRSKYRFYNPRSDEALPQLAQFFFQIYQVIGPAQTLLQHADSSKALRRLVVESFLPEEKRGILARLDPGALRVRVKEVSLEQLTEEVKGDLVELYDLCSRDRAERMNRVYETILYLVGFVKFDFYFLLKKFDASFPEQDPSYTPRFEPISAEYVVDDLKDFLDVIGPLDPALPWQEVFPVLRLYKGVEVVDPRLWQRMFNALMAVKRSDILVKIVQHVEKNPAFQPEVRGSRQDIVEGVLEELRRDAEAVIRGLREEKRKVKLGQLLRMVFGTDAVARSRYYTEATASAFARHDVGTFLYVEPFNYLKAFLLDFYKRDVRMLAELFIVRGKWTAPQVSQELSDAYYRVMDIAQEVVELDESLSDEGERGQKIRQYLHRSGSGKEPAVKRVLKQYIDDVNEAVRRMVMETAQNLISIGKIFKSLIEDSQGSKREVILNWREVENAYEGEDLQRDMVETYKKIYYFIQILQLFFTRKRQPEE
ncbi:DUF5312 family protein [Spirochaeta thermophila]|uniref:Uncharacterized protein n=1 Tax=Winmispira thermophila (strain ATCC 49972 / DSM 6192 / RI 19.B1) TaxID=665571 RepID=E0RNQ5_WINT6|nr:DUF5312 family protein [Spirochaeta thermophila]ADN01177.1 hypothetical protein STHERM_c02030 [Spirochaeta thermophila DSM 6192]